MSDKNIVVIGISGALCVALGAYGAHGLKDYVESGKMNSELLNAFDTGVKYQMYHTLAMLMVFLLNLQKPDKKLYWANRLFFAGIVLFSGSLYLLSTRLVTEMEWLRFLGPVTPLGGLLFMAGWILLGLSALTKTKKTKTS